MKSPSELTVLEMKNMLSDAGVTGVSSLNRTQTSSKYRYHCMKKKSSPKKRSKSPKKRSKSPKKRSKSAKRRSKSPKRRSKSPKKRSKSPRMRSKSPKRRSKSPRRGPLPACNKDLVRRTSNSKCVVKDSTEYKTLTELKDEARALGLVGLTGATKSQLSKAIKRQKTCPSPKVIDKNGTCRDRIVRLKKEEKQRLAIVEKAEELIAQRESERERENIGPRRLNGAFSSHNGRYY